MLDSCVARHRDSARHHWWQFASDNSNMPGPDSPPSSAGCAGPDKDVPRAAVGGDLAGVTDARERFGLGMEEL
jgi:hypothetical protein